MDRITPDAVRHVALLSRLEVTDDEIQRFAGDLSAILEYAAKLKELDTSNIPPTSHSLPMQNVFREDVIRPSLTNDEALANAPDAENGCFKVPAVIQET